MAQFLVFTRLLIYLYRLVGSIFDYKCNALSVSPSHNIMSTVYFIFGESNFKIFDRIFSFVYIKKHIHVKSFLDSSQCVVS